MEDNIDYSQLSDYELAVFKYYQPHKILKFSEDEIERLFGEENKRNLPREFEEFKEMQKKEDQKDNPNNVPKCPQCKTLKSKKIQISKIGELYSTIWAYNFGRYSIREYYQCVLCTRKYSISVTSN